MQQLSVCGLLITAATFLSVTATFKQQGVINAFLTHAAEYSSYLNIK